MDLEPVAGVGPTPEGEGVMSEQVEEETQDLVVQDPGEAELEVDLLDGTLQALSDSVSMEGIEVHQGLQGVPGGSPLGVHQGL